MLNTTYPSSLAYRILAASLFLMLALGCNTSREATTRTDSGLDELMELMSGSFSSAEQAASDTNYYPIVLHMYPIWSQKGKWLYVEQTLASTPDRPYRQRVYHLEQVARDRYRSVVYTLPDPAAFIGAWQDPGRFRELSPLSLEIRSGCDVYLNKVGRRNFEGGTEGVGCSSELAGASYASSEVLVKPGEIISWDRGFDEAGNQVWGATQGGYQFKRQ